jgi:hypothetical protein
MNLAHVAWIPLVLLIVVEVYASGFDGYGAWSTGPLFLLPALVGLIIGAAGFVASIGEARAQRPWARMAGFTVLALLPMAWLFVRRFVV